MAATAKGMGAAGTLLIEDTLRKVVLDGRSITQKTLRLSRLSAKALRRPPLGAFLLRANLLLV